MIEIYNKLFVGSKFDLPHFSLTDDAIVHATKHFTIN